MLKSSHPHRQNMATGKLINQTTKIIRISEWGDWHTAGDEIELSRSIYDFQLLIFKVGWDSTTAGNTYPIIPTCTVIPSSVTYFEVGDLNVKKYVTIRIASETKLEIIASNVIGTGVRQVFGMF